MLGVVQWIATPVLFKSAEEPTFWFFGGGITLWVVGALNLLRIRYGSIARGVLVVSVTSNVLLALFWVAMAVTLEHKFSRYGAPYVALAIIVLNAILSLWSTRTRRPSGK